MRKIFPFAVIFIFLIACSSNTKKGPKNAASFTLNVSEVLAKENKDAKPLRLSQLTNAIRYIPLQTSENCMIKYLVRVSMCSDFIIVSDVNTVYQFDISGNYIRQIGGIGHGPGEYTGRIRTFTDYFAGEIFILGSNTVNVYDLNDGFFKREFSVNLDVSDFAFFTDGNIAFFTNETDSETLIFTPNEVYLTNPMGEIIDSIANNLRSQNRSNIIGPASVFMSDNQVYYNYFLRDTIYSLNEEFSRKPYITFFIDNETKRGDLMRLPLNDIQYPDHFWLTRSIMSDQYVFSIINVGISPGLDQNSRKIVFDKEASKIISTLGINNDIDGGKDFWPNWIGNDFYIDFYYAFELLDYYHQTKGEVTHSEDFLKLISQLDHSDNPILVLVKINS